MNKTQFCYWLRGFTELNPESIPTEEQWEEIKRHLEMTFEDTEGGGGGC